MRFRPPPVGRGDAPESECRLTRGGPPPPIRGNLQEAGLEQPRRQGDLEARSRVPATLVDTTFDAIADAGSIPAVSTATDRRFSFRRRLGRLSRCTRPVSLAWAGGMGARMRHRLALLAAAGRRARGGPDSRRLRRADAPMRRDP